MRIQRSALRHGITASEIKHAWDYGVGDLTLDARHEPPKRLRIGPDYAGNFLELVYLEAADEPLIIHAMALGVSLKDHLNRLRP